MAYTLEQIVDTHKSNMEALQSMAAQAFVGLQRLTELNMATGSISLTRAFSHVQSVLDMRDPQQLLGLQLGLYSPIAMRCVSYGSHVYDIATETGAECFQTIADMVERAEKNMPDAVPAVSVLKSAVTASQKAIEAAQGTAKKAVELAESNLEAQAAGASHSASGAKKRH